MRLRRSTAFVLVALGLTTASRGEAADTWPVARHDAARTGASSGSVPAGSPTTVWRAYMGGRPIDATARFGLADPAIVVASTGGRFVAKDVVTQAVLWQSDLVGTGQVADIRNVGGDALAEVVAYTEDRAYVLSAATGAILWTSPAGAFGRVGAVRAVDMNGDGTADVYIDDASGAKTGAYCAAAYAFAAGFGAPAELWARPLNAAPPAINSGTDAIVDLDGDGVPEVALASYDEMLLVRGDNGATIASLALPSFTGHPFSHAGAVEAELDGQPGKELLVVQPNGQVVGSHGPPGLLAFKVDPATSQWSHLWTKTSGSFDGEVVNAADVVADIDGDGVHEILLSYRSSLSGGAWATEVLAGATGQAVFSIPGARFEGAAALDGDPGAEIVVAKPDGLSVYSIKNGALAQAAGPLAGHRALTVVDADLRRRGETQRRLAVVKRAGQPPQLIAGQPAGTVPYADLAAARSFSAATSLTLGAAGFVQGDTYSPALGAITDVVRADFATRPYEQIAAGTSDGKLDVLDDTMKVTNGIVVIDEPAVGTQLGGAMQPRIGAEGGALIGKDGEGPFVVLPGSPGGLLLADAKSASLVIPPKPRWVRPGMGSPSIIPVGAGMLGPLVVGIEGHEVVARLSGSGQEVGSHDLGPGSPAGAPLPLKVAGLDAPLVGVDWRLEGVQIVQSAINFSSNSLVWEALPFAFGGFYASGVGDLDGDGNDEWYWVNDVLHRRSAATGQLDTFPAVSTGYSIPMVADFMGSQAPDILLQAGVTAPKLVSSSLALAWEGPLPEQMNVMAGTRVACPSGARFVTPAVQSPFLRAFEGATGALVGERVLAGGAAYASIAEATLAGAQVGSLSNASSLADAGMQGPLVLVGSTDGFLYGLRGCSLDLVWAKDLGAPVAEAAIGSVDADATVEIVVGAADGYVYGLDWPPIVPPGDVMLVGAGQGEALHVAVGEDVSVQWGAVPGAGGYEIALVDPNGRALRDPAYQGVSGTSATVSLDGALAGRPYRAVVRARSGDQYSADVASPPIVIVDTAAPFASAEGAPLKGPEASIHIEGKDDLALDYYLVQWREAADPKAPLMFLGDDLLAGSDASASFVFEAPEAAWGKAIEIAVDVVDSGGNATRVTLSATVGADGSIHFDPTSSDPPLGADPSASDLAASGGCAIGSLAGAPRDGALFLAASLGLALARRRRRRA